jgi:hypothetical protein
LVRKVCKVGVKEVMVSEKIRIIKNKPTLCIRTIENML